MANILITGGAGYVGSHTCVYLLSEGHDVTVVDDLSVGRKELVVTKNFVQAKVGDRKAILSILENSNFDCVMHFAASAIVTESFEKPEFYFQNNVTQTEKLLEVLIERGIDKFIFSSSCAIFGNSQSPLITEKHPKKPISPYGESKLECEKLLERLTKTTPLKCIILRYFNAAGADPGLRVGEWHSPETRLIPLAIRAARQNTELNILGTDYETPDGTCIRDYIHVWDIAWAHAKALNRILRHPVQFEDFNIGSEKGFSVLEIIRAVEKVTNTKIRVRHMPKRIGDSPKMIASNAKAQKLLAFEPKTSDLKSIIESAVAWDRKIYGGY